MIALVLLIALGFALFRLLGGAPVLRRRTQPHELNAAKIEELTDYASKLRQSNNFTKAEKVYLQILKIDHRHAPTYSRLGTLYSAMRNRNDAIECFQIASQLDPSGNTFFNLGLAFYENRNPLKSIAAMEKSIMFEPTVQRYVGLAKAFSRLGNNDQMIQSLEQAADMEPSAKVLWLLADAYEGAGRTADQAAVFARIKGVAPRDPRLKTVPREVMKAAMAAQAHA